MRALVIEDDVPTEVLAPAPAPVKKTLESLLCELPDNETDVMLYAKHAALRAQGYADKNERCALIADAVRKR